MNSGSDVAILTYPGYSLVSEFTVAKDGYPPATTFGMCTDASGHIFIEADYYGGSTIFEYNHGGTTPVSSLYVGSYIVATDCARDPSTGNLAVTSYGENTHAPNVAIFANATGTPQYYTDPGILVYASCAYDNSGDLFIDGYTGSGVIKVAELPRGGSEFTNISLNQGLHQTGALQWVGGDLSIQDGNTLYTVSISGSTGTVLRTTALSRKSGAGLAYISGNSAIAQDYGKKDHYQMGVWRYPKGRKPVEKFDAGNVRNPFSEVVSIGSTP